MSSLSDRAEEFVSKQILSMADGQLKEFTDLRWELVRDMAVTIEGMAQANHALADTVERMQLRIEELESQVAQLAPPKSVGPIVKPVRKPVSESDLPSVRPPGWGQ